MKEPETPFDTLKGETVGFGIVCTSGKILNKT